MLHFLLANCIAQRSSTYRIIRNAFDSREVPNATGHLAICADFLRDRAIKRIIAENTEGSPGSPRKSLMLPRASGQGRFGAGKLTSLANWPWPGPVGVLRDHPSC
jgi:hypothetical protein